MCGIPEAKEIIFLVLTVTLEAHRVKTSVLDGNTACHMCRHLVAHHFQLSADDLALWDAEPESFATDEAGESWKYSLRVCGKYYYFNFDIVT